MAAVSEEEISLIIDHNALVVKRKVSTKRPDDSFISKAKYSTSLPINSAIAKDPSGIIFPVVVSKRGELTDVEIDFSSVPHQPLVLKYTLQLLVSSTIIERFGSLNILNWPPENISAIYILSGSGTLFFTSAYSKVRREQGTLILHPPGYMKRMVSHVKNASALRVEWGNPSTTRLIFKYTIQNQGNSIAQNIKLKTNVPPETIFQHVKNNFNYQIQKDEDNNAIVEVPVNSILPGGKAEVTLICDVTPNGNMNAVIPELGTFQGYRDILLVNRETARFILDTKIWDYATPSIQAMIKTMLNKAKNPTEYMKMAFEFVNQKIKYKINNIRDSASNTLKKLSGDCSEYSDLFVALLRGGGIPAKIVHGVIVDYKKKILEPHAWCEYFSPQLGWIQCDPTWGFVAGVCCQHISRQREGLEDNLPTYAIEYHSSNSELKIDEKVEFRVIPN